MPIKVKLVALLILISGFAHAADKKDAFIKAIDYCNCRIASTYCKQYSGMKPESPEKKSYDGITYIFKCSIDQSLAFDSINRILKRNNFAEFSKKSSAVFGRIANTYCKQYAEMKPDSKEKKSYDLIKNSFNCAIGSTKPFLKRI